MMTVAYTEMELSVEEFLNLSWYEWMLEIFKLRAKNKRRLDEWESNTFVIRRFMTLFAQANTPKGNPSPKDTDWGIKLSFDKDDLAGKEKIIPPEEVEAKFGKFLKSPINGK